MNTFFKPTDNKQEDTHYQCRHIRTSGHRCLCPALRGEKFCYYHHTNRPAVPKAEAQRRKSKRGTFSIALPEDRTSIQHNLGSIMQRLATNDIDLKRAGLLLYALQIASANLPKEDPRKKPQPTVEEITHDPELGIIAPETTYTNAEPPTASETILLEWKRMGEEVRAADAQHYANRKTEFEHEKLDRERVELERAERVAEAQREIARRREARQVATNGAEPNILPTLNAASTPTLTSIRSGLWPKNATGAYSSRSA